MAKTSILLLLVSSILLLVVADQAAAAATKQLSPAAQKSIDDLSIGLQKVIDDVVTAVPPAKQKETMLAVVKHLKPVRVALEKAKETGDEKKIARLAFRVEIVATMVKHAPPEKKLQTMDEAISSVATPSKLDCPTVDKAYCETDSKINEAIDGVVAAAPAEKRLEIKAVVLKKTVRTAADTIDKVYADGDEKKIAQVLAAYSKAADEVIVAAPAEKLNVMEKTFATAAAAGN